jgi:hypothetical protein
MPQLSEWHLPLPRSATTFFVERGHRHRRRRREAPAPPVPVLADWLSPLLLWDTFFFAIPEGSY